MFMRWQSRKRQQPDIGPWHDALRDETGECVRNKRWDLLRTRIRADGTVGLDVRWSAVIVESVRVNGKPRQRYVSHLASITESRIEVVHQRRYFWDAVLDGLDRLGNRMSVEDRQRIEAAIALKVPRLTREEHEASVEECTEDMMRHFGSDIGPQKPYRPQEAPGEAFETAGPQGHPDAENA
jgi:hypothetical protein